MVRLRLILRSKQDALPLQNTKSVAMQNGSASSSFRPAYPRASGWFSFPSLCDFPSFFLLGYSASVLPVSEPSLPKSSISWSFTLLRPRRVVPLAIYGECFVLPSTKFVELFSGRNFQERQQSSFDTISYSSFGQARKQQRPKSRCSYETSLGYPEPFNERKKIFRTPC